MRFELRELAHGAALDLLGVGVIVQDKSGDVVECNQRARDLLDLDPDDPTTTRAAGFCWASGGLCADHLLPLDLARIERLSFGDTPLEVHHRGGEKRRLAINAKPIVFDGAIAGAVATFADVTADCQAKDRAGENQHNLLEGLLASRLAVATSDANGILLRANHQFAAMVGRAPDEIVGRHFTTFAGPDSLSETMEAVDQIRNGAFDEFEVHRTYLRPDGSIRHGLMNLLALRDSAGRLTQHVSIVHDITERVRTESALIDAAATDELTGLLNRRGLHDRLAALLSEPDPQLVVAFIDLDNFKSINDRFGHGEGDRVLAELGEAIQRQVRNTDIVARYGGDEFVVVFPGATPDAIAELGSSIERAVASVRGPDGQPIRGSTGCASAEMGMGVWQLLERSDQSMYRNKQRAKRLRSTPTSTGRLDAENRTP